MNENRNYKLFVVAIPAALAFLVYAISVPAAVVVQSQTPVEIGLTGYNGLNETPLFTGSLEAGKIYTINTPYRGLAQLIFAEGSSYPVIIGEQTFSLHISNYADLPAFAGSDENERFYNFLTGGDLSVRNYHFAFLMIRAKQLLESSYDIRTVDELRVMKEKFYNFVSGNYNELQHSDMLIRLIGQYFMMHEYVDYHIEGAPANDIQVRYKKAVVDGVADWIRVLKEFIPGNEVLNYCVSLYYKRSMVSLAQMIINNFREIAFCPGKDSGPIILPEDLAVCDAKGEIKGNIGEVGYNSVAVLVSDNCPVSMVEAVAKARQLSAAGKDENLIIVPLQSLSDKHLALCRMIAGDNMFFVNDDDWRQKHLPDEVRLPRFINIADKAVSADLKQ